MTVVSERIEYKWGQRISNLNKKLPSVRYNLQGGVYNDYLYLLLGAGTVRSSEVWKYSIKNSNWSFVICIESSSPSPRDGHSATYIGNGKFLIFGGQKEPTVNSKTLRSGEQVSKTRTLLAREVFNDLYEFDCEAQKWNLINCINGPPPTARRLHCANYIHYTQEYCQEVPLNTLSTQSLLTKNITSMSSLSESRRARTHYINREVPNNSLIIYGGSGIEPSKKNEQVYNDLWAFVYETKNWVALKARGPIPRPQSGHKSEIIGDLLVIIGGIPATQYSLSKNDQKLAASLENITSDVMTLHLRTLTWAYLDIRDTVGRSMSLNLHGHSMTSDGNDILIFGGKEAVDSRELEAKRFTYKNYFWRLNVGTGTVTPIVAKDLPENRHGHIGISINSNNDPNTPASIEENNKIRQGIVTTHAVDDLMLVFGGSSLEAGGFMDPEVFVLTKLTTVKTDNSDNDNMSRVGGRKSNCSISYAATDVVSSGSTRRSSAQYRGYSFILPSSRQQMSDYKNGMDMMHMENVMDNKIDIKKQKTIWEKIHDRDIHTSDGISVNSMTQPSESWKDLKLALSYPTTITNSDMIKPMPIIYPVYYKKEIIRHLKKNKMPDSIRIGKALNNEINSMRNEENKYKSLRESLSATLLIGENKHTLNKDQEFGSSFGNTDIKMMRSLDTGTGNLDVHNFEKSTTKFKKLELGLADIQVQQLYTPKEIYDQKLKINSISRTLLPLSKGLKKSELKKIYLDNYPVALTLDDYDQTNVVLSHGLSLNFSTHY